MNKPKCEQSNVFYVHIYLSNFIYLFKLIFKYFNLFIYLIYCHAVVKVVFVLFLSLWFRLSHGGSQLNGSGIRRPTTLMTQNERKLISPPQNIVLTIHSDAGGFGMKVGFFNYFFFFFIYLFSFSCFIFVFMVSQIHVTNLWTKHFPKHFSRWWYSMYERCYYIHKLYHAMFGLQTHIVKHCMLWWHYIKCV